ncbi:MAG TPA: glycerol kinase GlpK [Stellaceae bacterium]|nr:glycerol kinase GlpK [Stellaceae bacterium]
MSRPDYLLAIDQGTTSTRAILFDAAGGVHHTARRPVRQIHPHPGWVEHDAEAIWQDVVACCREAIAAADGAPIAAIGISNQRETTVLWDRQTGRPMANAIVWQDRRTAPLCEEWRAAGLEELVAERTGLIIDPYFSASKIRWLLGTVPGLADEARAGRIAFGTIDSFLLWRLTGGRLHATDVTNASRTMLFDLRRLAWDDELLAALGVPRAVLPETMDSDGDFDETAPELFGGPIPIAGVAGDQHAAAIGQACFRPGLVKSTYGTGAFALVNTGPMPARSRHRLIATLCYRLRGETAYALEGSIFTAGAALDWLCRGLRVAQSANALDALAAAADPRQRVYFVPALTGLGAPHWSAAARGAISGLTAGCGLPEIARAALEAIGFQTRDLIAAMASDTGLGIETLRVDGGLAANDWAMQFLADILPVRVERPATVETTAWGAAYIAGLARGLCPEPAAMMAGWHGARQFAPAMDAAEREERYAGWRRAVAGVLTVAG